LEADLERKTDGGVLIERLRICNGKPLTDGHSLLPSLVVTMSEWGRAGWSIGSQLYGEFTPV
jgi:hypothetical protein